MITPEQKGIRISLVGAISFALLGLSFALWSGSQAVLLDGAFNLITAVMVLFALRITKLLNEPLSERLPVGYVALEPFYVLTKGLLLFVFTVFVMVSNVIIMLQGGNELKLGIIVIYLGVAMIGNLIIYVLVRRLQTKAQSPMLEVEKENWKVNALITAGICVAFLLVFLLKDGKLAPVVPYVDQVVVLLVGLGTIGVPLQAIRNGIKDLLLISPGESVQIRIEDLISQHIGKNELRGWKVYVLKTGRK